MPIIKTPKAKLKRIKQQNNEEIFFPALGFTSEFWRAGDFVALTLANLKLGHKYGANGLYFLSLLHAAERCERQTGFFHLYILSDVLTRDVAYMNNRKLLQRGFFTPVPFPLHITHFARVRKVYKLSDKGREALRYFRSEYMKHQKLSKKARLKMMESLNTF